MSSFITGTLFPHRRASALFDARIDALRGEGELSPEETAFLDRHVGACARCRAAFEARRRAVDELRGLGTAKAPEGFAGRVLLAARARGRAEVPREELSAVRPRWFELVPMQQAAAAAFVVVLIAGAVLAGIGGGSTGSDARDGAGVSALAPGGGLAEKVERPHFVVRAPGIGVAKARSQVTAIVQAHRGSFDDRPGAIVARIPRSELIRVTQDLASRGRYKMTKAGELAPEAEEVVIRFEIE